jgi:hypothetical protein
LDINKTAFTKRAGMNHAHIALVLLLAHLALLVGGMVFMGA